MKSSMQLKAILQASGWSQEELARRLGVSLVTLNTWVNDRSEPRAKSVDAIRELSFKIMGGAAVDQPELDAQKAKALALKIKTHRIVSDQALLDKLTLHLTYHTNTIEGSTMTLDDTNDVLFVHKVLTNRTQIEQMEARNHQAALLWLLEQLEQKSFSITEELILGLHLRLMNGIISDAGQYRRHGVRIMGTHVTVTNYVRIEVLMMELLQAMKAPQENVIREFARTHATFEKIHPFSDGNGRIGRLLLLAQCLQAGLIPPLVLRERKHAYYSYLEMAQMKDELVPLELFIAESMIETDKLLFNRKTYE